jgi:hypothetical protein
MSSSSSVRRSFSSENDIEPRRIDALSLTAQAKNQLGPFVRKANKTNLVVRCQNVFENEVNLTISLDDVAEYYATEARNLSSGCRTLAGLTGDWRYIDQLASMSLEWFKRVNVRGMRAAGRRHGIEPKF